MNIISRREAIKSELVSYFTGKPCKFGHVDKRYTVNGVCYSCREQYYIDHKENFRQYRIDNEEHYKQHSKQYCKRYYDGHKSSIKQYHKQYRVDHIEHITQRDNQYRINNKEHIKQHRIQNKEHYNQYHKQWRTDNPDKVALLTERRRLYLKSRTPKWYEEDLIKQLYLKRDQLNNTWGTNLEVDHIIPIISKTVCGLHCWANLQLLDASLNSSKNNSHEQDW